MYCEDFPCCGHTNMDPCDGSGPSYTASEYEEAFWCGMCGMAHQGDCGGYEDDSEW